jgi:sigma-B regulation protein RsbU (phosphoserine phosphatase)
MAQKDYPKLLKQCQRRNDRLQKALEINRLIAGELNLGPLLGQIMKTTQSIMEAESCSLFLLDDETGDLVFHATSGRDEAHLKEICRLAMGCGIAGWSAEHKQTVRLSDVYDDPRFNVEYDRQTGFTTINMICSPLIVHGKLIGVSQVINSKHGKFTESDEQLMEAIVQMVAIAIDNARTHQRLLEQEVLQRDLELAKSIQNSFLPESAPEVPGYEVAFHMNSAYEVGGDFYDTVRMPDQRVAYLLGDISGKGVSAAMVMSTVLRDIHAELAEGGSAGEILSRFNISLCKTASNGMFVSLILMILDQRSGDMEIANAGHPPPVLLQQQQSVQQAGASGPPAGIITDIQYGCVAIALQPEEMVLLYSDGITEARNELRRMVGVKRLLAWLNDAPNSPQACIDFLVTEVQQYIGQAKQADDITLLALRKSPAPNAS